MRKVARVKRFVNSPGHPLHGAACRIVKLGSGTSPDPYVQITDCRIEYRDHLRTRRYVLDSALVKTPMEVET